MSVHCNHCAEIAALTAERDELREIVGKMRENLELAKSFIGSMKGLPGQELQGLAAVAVLFKIDEALALKPKEAA